VARDLISPRHHINPLERAERQRQLLLRVSRFAFLILFGTVALLSILSVTPSSDPADIRRAMGWWAQTLVVAAVLGVLVILIDIFTPHKKVGTLFSVFVGLLAAMLGTVAVGFIIDLLAITFDIGSRNLIATTKVLTGIGLAYLCISTVIQTQDDFRLVIPYVEFSKQIRGTRPMLLDSSALIDARIADLGQTGIIQSPVIIPSFVIAELHILADSSDKLKRARGRRGLDVIGRMQRLATLDVSLDETPVPGKAVDQMLVELARQLQATIVTADLALSRIAGIQGIRVLNLNDVANALKPAVVPGEQLSIRLLKQGEQPGQGVGYLEDGTMVVAENGRPWVGDQVMLTVTSTLQTSAGRLIFGRVLEPEELAESDTPDLASEPQPFQAEQAPQAVTAAAPAATDPLHQQEQGPRAPDATARTPFPPKPAARRPNPARNPRR
jgi:uncharacterized protein YacL